jgi:hypothetical protein
MAQPRVAVLGDQLVADLNGATFETSFQATRAYLPVMQLEDAEALRVTVVLPPDLEAAPDNRSEWEYRITVEVGVQKKFSKTPTNGDLDPLVRLLEQITDYYRFSRPTTGVWQMDGEPLIRQWDVAHLRDWNQYTGVVILTFIRIDS